MNIPAGRKIQSLLSIVAVTETSSGIGFHRNQKLYKLGLQIRPPAASLPQSFTWGGF
jgi:hypothetical protein